VLAFGDAGEARGEWAALGRACTGFRQTALCAQRVGKLDQDLIETGHGVSQACRHSSLPEQQAGFGRPHGVAVQAAHLRDLADEDSVQPIDLRLQRGSRLWRQRCMGRKVVFVVAGVDRGEVDAVLGILDRLIDVQRNNTDGPHPGGLGQGQA